MEINEWRATRDGVPRIAAEIHFGRADISVAPAITPPSDVPSSFEHHAGAAMPKSMGDTERLLKNGNFCSRGIRVLSRVYPNPSPVIAVPSALTNSSGQMRLLEPRSRLGDRPSLPSTAEGIFLSGPYCLPATRMLGVRWRRTLSSRRPSNSETRSPPAKQRSIIARSGIPRRS
jgi:hypothetical protein